MSRCFPFRTPNYREEEKILTESIKLQKEQEASTSKERRKEKKRDRKEKRKRSKDKRENSKDSKRAHKKRKLNEANELPMKGVVAEPLERSGLTEERGLPCLTPEPCKSSESTQTSSKGTIIRFKLPLQRHGADEPCFSGRGAMELGESSRSHERGRGKERKYRELIIDWKPAALFAGGDGVEDLGWLLAEPRCSRVSSEAKSCSGNSREDLSSVQPRACYLPELDMYQLPYVIPF